MMLPLVYYCSCGRPLGGRRKRCADCQVEHERNRTRLAQERRRRLDPTLKAREYRATRERQGKTYTPRSVIRQRSEARREREQHERSLKKAVRTARSKQYWVERLLKERPELFSQDISVSGLYWRARYHLDAAFRSAEIERVAMRRSREHGDSIISDGSLDGRTVQHLFAKAKICPYCDKKMDSRERELDHIIPRHRGGWHSVANVIVCCKACNSAKASKTPEQWLARHEASRRSVIERRWDKATNGRWREAWLTAA